MGMDYSKIDQWILAEDALDPAHLGKCEAVMSLGNGYLGLRSATEERYVGETRNLLINGTFNKFDEAEVTELPNAADVTAVELWFNGFRFSLDQGTYTGYSRELNIRTGELTRRVVWTSPKGGPGGALLPPYCFPQAAARHCHADFRNASERPGADEAPLRD